MVQICVYIIIICKFDRLPDESSTKLTLFLFCNIRKKGLNECPTYSGVEAQVTDVTGDDGFLFVRGHAERVADHRLLHWVHLRGERQTKTHIYTHRNTLVRYCFLFFFFL